MRQKQVSGRGFTLLELLIVIAIIAILSVILILVLNPAETLKKSRDAQRISDLNTVKTALGLYLTSTSTPLLGGAANIKCLGNAEDTIYYSQTGVTAAAAGAYSTRVGSAGTLVDGTGWIPVDLSTFTGGSPISNFPLDPTNTVTATPVAGDLVYRYACQASPLTFELDARLESSAYTVDDNKMTKDGGNDTGRYEVGTNLAILLNTDY